MDKFIGFDIDHKHSVACVVQAGQSDRYRNRIRLKNAAKSAAEQQIRVKRWQNQQSIRDFARHASSCGQAGERKGIRFHQ